MEKPTRNKNIPLILKNSIKATSVNIAYLRNIQKLRTENAYKPKVKIVRSIIKENVLFDTTDAFFLKGEYQRLLIVNRLHLITKFSTTIAKFISSDGTVLEKTSDRVAKIIGQEQYKTVLSGLCSIIDQNLKIRSILALLTVNAVKTEDTEVKIPKLTDKCCQTDEMRIEQLRHQRRRIRKKQGPYIVKDFKLPEPAKKVKKVVINIPNLDTNSVTQEHQLALDNDSKKVENSNSTNTQEVTNTCSTKTDTQINEKCSSDTLPDLGHLHDDNSNDSLGKLSTFSIETSPELIFNPMSILNDIDQRTKHTDAVTEDYIVQPNHIIKVMDGQDVVEIELPSKPEDDLHIATKDNFQFLDDRSRQLLIKYQMILDLKHCLTVMDEDGNLPIHLAVLNDDIELIRRQCIVLKLKNRSVDIQANRLTPLKMSLYQATVCSTALLLQFGADILQVDSDHRTPVHLAAELKTDHLSVLLNHCKDNARKVLSDLDLMKPGMENKSDEELGKCLLKRICSMADKQGYTPLMLATLLGNYDNVRLLLDLVPDAVNFQMPTSGNTALFLACNAACNSSAERGNKSKVEDHFQKTIEILIEKGADPAIDNYSSSNVNTLLAEFNCQALSLFISSKLTKCNFQKNFIIPETSENFDKVMLIKSKTGKVDLKALENEKPKKPRKKPITILENLVINKPLKSPTSDAKSPRNGLNNESTKTSDTVSQNAGNHVKKIIILPSPKKILKRKMAAPAKETKIAKIDK